MFAFAIWDRRAPAAVPGARPTGQEAALLLASRPPLPLRVGAQGAALSSGGLPRARLARVPALPGVRLHAGQPVDLRRASTSCRRLTPRRSRTAASRSPLLAASAGGRRAPRRPELAESAAAMRDELREAVRLRLESDVPLGVFLSGGLDSSAVVASMREITSGRIATFSVGFGGGAAPSYDELPVRAPGRPAVRDRPPRGDPRARRARDAPGDRAGVRRAVRGLLGDPDVHRGPGDRAPRQGRAVGDRRRRDLRRLSALSRPPRCRRPTTDSRAGSATPRARSPAGCPTRAGAGTGATVSAASPISPTPAPAIATSAGHASSVTPTWRRWPGRRWPRASSRDWTRPGAPRSPPALMAIPWTAHSASISTTYLPDDLLAMADRMSMATRSRCARRSATTGSSRRAWACPRERRFPERG